MDLPFDSDDYDSEEEYGGPCSCSSGVREAIYMSTVILFTIYCYFSFVFVLAIPLRWHRWGPGLVHFALFNFSAILYCFSFWKSATTNPGLVPKIAIFGEEIKNRIYRPRASFHGLLEDYNPERVRFCSTCETYMPPRSHHCRQCKSMDHHCLWINNCVGLGNYKYFLLLLVHGECAIAYLILASAYRVIQCFQMNYGNGDQMMGLNPHEAILLIFNIFLIFPIYVSLSYLLFYHLKCSLSNKTSVEDMIYGSIKKVSKKNSLAVPKWIYDVGWANNLSYVLGTNPLLWVIPVNTKALNGYNYPIRPEYKTLSN